MGAGRGHLGHMHDTHKMTERRSIESLNFIGHWEDILTSHGPFNREYDPTYSHFSVSKRTNQTNKHRHFQEIRG